MQGQATINLPPKLVPVFQGEARYRGAHGGRGSGKTYSFAKMTAVRGYLFGSMGVSGVILCAREHLNSLKESSFREVAEAIKSEPFLAAYYDIGRDFIRSKDGRIEYVFLGLRHNTDSIKSTSRILIAWVDEAERVSDEAWLKLIPTVRAQGDNWQSEIWVTWNPESKRSATHRRFRESPPDSAKIVQLNHYDNPWFPGVLDGERQEDFRKRRDMYDHIWEGDFIQAFEGAYYATQLSEAAKQGRIRLLARDPLLKTYAVWDIGGTGRLADATAIWVFQVAGERVRFLRYYEAQGQELSTHVGWLRSEGYDSAHCILPHDGGTKDKVYRVSYETALKDAGFAVTVIPNQGAGAAKLRIEATRRRFPGYEFDEFGTNQGREVIAWYHEKIDQQRGIGLGPEHDWSSHGSDAFGLTAIALDQIDTGSRPKPRRKKHGSAWAA